MFTVQPFCKFTILLIWVIIILPINMSVIDIRLILLSAISFIFIWRHLDKLKIYISGTVLTKETGKTFKHKNIVMLKNISNIHFVKINDWLPALIRIHWYNNGLYIIGLNGRQRSILEKYIKMLK